MFDYQKKILHLPNPKRQKKAFFCCLFVLLEILHQNREVFLRKTQNQDYFLEDISEKT